MYPSRDNMSRIWGQSETALDLLAAVPLACVPVCLSLALHVCPSEIAGLVGGSLIHNNYYLSLLLLSSILSISFELLLLLLLSSPPTQEIQAIQESESQLSCLEILRKLRYSGLSCIVYHVSRYQVWQFQVARWFTRLDKSSIKLDLGHTRLSYRLTSDLTRRRATWNKCQSVSNTTKWLRATGDGYFSERIIEFTSLEATRHWDSMFGLAQGATNRRATINATHENFRGGLTREELSLCLSLSLSLADAFVELHDSQDQY